MDFIRCLYHLEMGGSMGEVVQEGMSLRDYFAANAMQAYITRQGYDMDGNTFDERISRWSYETADAMLRARGQS